VCHGPYRCIRCRRPGHRERFCRALFPAARSRSPDTRARSPDVRSPCQQIHSVCAQPRRSSASRSWAEVVCHSSLRAATPPGLSPRGCEEFNVNACLESLVQSHVALMRMQLL
jgi:hypothetical protein